MSSSSRLLFIVVLIFSLLSSGVSSVHSASDAKLLVFAAASTTNAVTDVNDLFSASGKGEATASFASSSTLAKQIAQGAPAGVFLSANQKWMDYLEKKGFIIKETRFDLLKNRLVLIAPIDRDVPTVEIKPGFDLKGLLDQGRLAMGDPTHVPAGMYARQALESLGIWKGLESRVAAAAHVRAALALVERGEAPLGIVYATDAGISDKVKVVGTFPESTHPPIVYPVAAVAGTDAPLAEAYLEFLKSPKASEVFIKYGFQPN